MCLNPVVFKKKCAETRSEIATPLSDDRMLLQMDDVMLRSLVMYWSCIHIYVYICIYVYIYVHM